MAPFLTADIHQVLYTSGSESDTSCAKLMLACQRVLEEPTILIFGRLASWEEFFGNCFLEQLLVWRLMRIRVPLHQPRHYCTSRLSGILGRRLQHTDINGPNILDSC